jgi:hypothetical protein
MKLTCSLSPATPSGHEPEAEQAVISALVALVLKLSEVRFKPLFLRLLEWATLPALSGRISSLSGGSDDTDSCV